jgi:hypothetical protein
MTLRMTGALLLCFVCGCSSMLPRSKEATASAWKSYEEAQLAFDRIQAGSTTVEELRSLNLDPATNPNIAILNYSDVLRRFLLNPSVTVADLDDGVRLCVSAKIVCWGYEITQKTLNKHRNGSFWLDFLGFKRETHTAGWKFNGLILIKDGVVIYKLTGGQPAILEQEESTTPLGPVQSVGDFLFGTLF